MKTPKVLITRFIPLLILVVIGNSIFAQDSTKNDKNAGRSAEVKELIESKNFSFMAQSVTPQRGGLRQLSSGYDLKVSQDAVEAYLPYFGRAYTAPINPSEAGIQFNVKEFEYDVKEARKSGWNVSIRPKGADVKQLFLNVSKNGYATLQVLSNSKQPISYQGYISKTRQRK